MVDRKVKVRLEGDVSDYNRSMLGATATTRAMSKELDSASGRFGILAQSALALGPALVPIGAAAVPAVAGLANQLGVAAGAAGTAALAFSGVGDALGAVNSFGIDPTQANLEKMRQAMSDLGPAGREFVTFLDDLRPQLASLQDAAQAGLFPGVQQGLTDLITLTPQVETIISELATTMGDLSAEAGEALSGPRWEEFFRYLETDAAPTLRDMGHALGNLTEGLANLWVAFDPLTDDFSAAMLDMSRNFREWTDSLSKTQGFEDFIEYTQRVGPEAWRTLGSIANALLQVVEAAAPIGEATLPVIEALADGLAAIADSPAGPVLIGTAAGMAALSRAIAVINLVKAQTLVGTLDRFGGKAGAIRGTAAGTNALAQSLERAATSAGIAAAAFVALDTGVGIIDAFSRSRGAVDATSESFGQLKKNLQESNVGAYADEFGIDVDRLAADIARYGDKGEYFAEVQRRMGETTEGLGGKINWLWDFLGPWTGDTGRAAEAQLDLGNIARKAAGDIDGEAGSSHRATDAVGGLAGSSRKAKDAQKAMAAEVSGASAAFLDFSAATDGGEASLRDWMGALHKQIKAQANWADNMRTLAKRGVTNGVLQELSKMGPEGAKYVAQLADGSKANLDKLNRWFKKSGREADGLGDDLSKLGKKHPKPKVDVDGIPPALHKVDNFWDSLTDLDGQHPEPKVSVDGVPESERDIKGVNRLLLGMPPGKPEVDVQGIPQALRKTHDFAGAFKRSLAGIADEDVNINVAAQMSKSLGKTWDWLAGASGHASGGPIRGYRTTDHAPLTEGNLS